MLNKGKAGGREIIAQLRHHNPAKQIEIIVGWMGTALAIRDFKMSATLQREFIRQVNRVVQIEDAIATPALPEQRYCGSCGRRSY